MNGLNIFVRCLICCCECKVVNKLFYYQNWSIRLLLKVQTTHWRAILKSKSRCMGRSVIVILKGGSESSLLGEPSHTAKLAGVVGLHPQWGVFLQLIGLCSFPPAWCGPVEMQDEPHQVSGRAHHRRPRQEHQHCITGQQSCDLTEKSQRSIPHQALLLPKHDREHPDHLNNCVVQKLHRSLPEDPAAHSKSSREDHRCLARLPPGHLQQTVGIPGDFMHPAHRFFSTGKSF